jgi:hypothetical protein
MAEQRSKTGKGRFERGLDKRERHQLAEVTKRLKEISKDRKPFDGPRPLIIREVVISPEEMIRIGQRIPANQYSKKGQIVWKSSAPRFKKDQKVFYNGQTYWVQELFPPQIHEPHLLLHLRSWGYGLREFNGKGVKMYISESELRATDPSKLEKLEAILN